MSKAHEPLALAAEFPQATREQWLALVEAVVRKAADGKPPEAFAAAFDRVLVTDTYEGIALQPLYTPDDRAGSGEAGLPGFAPFVRGRRVAGACGGGWDVRQRVEVTETSFPSGRPELAGGRARVELAGGATSVVLGLASVPRIDCDVLDAALDGVDLQVAPVVLDAGARFDEAAGALLALWARRGADSRLAAAVLGADPIGEHAASGGAADLAGDLDRAVAWAGRCVADHPRARGFVVDATRYHDAGASASEELGCALATGISYLRAMAAGGIPVGAACGQLEFRLAATADQFLTIAKLRAGRRLWTRAATVAGAPAGASGLDQHAETSRAMMTRYDPWVNLLRATVACFAAGIGGAEAVTVAPFDGLLQPGGSELGRRLARNTQAILMAESGLARVIDPGGGSWYIESLTDHLARAAWAFFQDVERSGGMAVALEHGEVQARIALTWEARATNLARRLDPLTGLSEFPDIDEKPPPRLSAVGTATSPAGSTSFAPLPRRRYAEGFESQRQRADRHFEVTGLRPTIFLARLGPGSAHGARGAFARNLFEVAGIRALPGPDGAEVGEIASAFARSGAGLACICSTDSIYAELAGETADALKRAGARRVYLAGKPDGRSEELMQAGVDEFLLAGGDALDTLTRALDALEVDCALEKR